MSDNSLYFIGAGPGSPDLITLRGMIALKMCKYVFLADSYRESFADFLENKAVYSPFEYLFKDITALIDDLLKEDDVAFLIPGDFSIFSPFQSIISHYKDNCTVIPGVGTLNAASSILKKTFDLPKVSSSIIITSPKSISKTDFSSEFSKLINKDSTLVLFMNNLPGKKLKEELLREYPKETPVAVVHKISMPEETVITTTVDNIPNDIDDEEHFNIGRPEPCLSMVIVGDVISAPGDPEFWDYRKINIWDKRKRDA